MCIYWNKRNCFHVSQGWFLTATWPPFDFHCCHTVAIWLPWRHVKMFYDWNFICIFIPHIFFIVWFIFQITGSLSDGLWNASMDSKFQESRDAMRAERFSSSKDHFVAGVKGLGMGLVGGLTSMVTQPIEGAHSAGLSVSSLSLFCTCESVCLLLESKLKNTLLASR